MQGSRNEQRCIKYRTHMYTYKYWNRKYQYNLYQYQWLKYKYMPSLEVALTTLAHFFSCVRELSPMTLNFERYATHAAKRWSTATINIDSMIAQQWFEMFKSNLVAHF